jgi:hypothetical protein
MSSNNSFYNEKPPEVKIMWNFVTPKLAEFCEIQGI